MKKILNNLHAKIIGFLLKGVTPEKLAMAMALGATMGIIPMLGVTTFICAILAYYLKLNMPAIQLVNYFMYPIQIILYIPFLKTGASFVGHPFHYTFQQIADMLSANIMETISKFFVINMYALLLWAIIAPVLYFGVYFILRTIFRKIRREEVSAQLSESETCPTTGGFSG
jgi:uncharacterized protein (DUF2062 family)